MSHPISRSCAWCGGTGKVSTGPGRQDTGQCEVCGGRGSRLMDSAKVLCPDCQGTGEAIEDRGLLGVLLGSEQPCPKCRGTGWSDPA